MDKLSTTIYMKNLESKDRRYNLCLQRFLNAVEEKQHLFPERQDNWLCTKEQDFPPIFMGVRKEGGIHLAGQFEKQLE